MYRRLAWQVAQSWADKEPDIPWFPPSPILVTIWLWAGEWANFVIRFWCDNLAVVHIINNLTSKSDCIMKLVMAFVLHTLQFNIVAGAIYS